MIGLCHECHSSGISIILDDHNQPICDSCNQKRYDTDTTKAKLILNQKKKELADLLRKHPELRKELNNAT